MAEEGILAGSEFGSALFTEMSRSILPIVAETNKRMQGVGSCTLLNVNDINYIVTAAHVLRQWGRKYPLYVSTEKETIEITWPFVMTNKGDENCDYNLDIAFSPIVPELQNLLSENHDAILTESFNIDPIDDNQEMLFAFGYPSSKVKFDKQQRVFKIVPMQYFGKRLDDSKLYEKSCSHIDDHLLINFKKRKTKHPAKNGYVIAPDPYGISGGGLFRVVFTDGPPKIYILEGILTEWHKKLSVMKCARTQRVRETILTNMTTIDTMETVSL